MLLGERRVLMNEPTNHQHTEGRSMTIFGPLEKLIAYVYTCTLCGCTYSKPTGPVVMSCMVNHAPGTCCHYDERLIPAEAVRSIEEVLKHAGEAEGDQ